MKKVKILISVLFFLLASSVVYAQGGPKIITLAKDQKAPFHGTLLNPAAVAHMVAEKESVENQCKLIKQYTEEREKAKCDLLVNTASVRLETLRLERDSIIGIKNDEIERLSKIALERPNRYNHWWFAGGVATGIITSITIFYAAVKVQEVN